MEHLTVFKIGGNIIDEEQVLSVFLRDFAALEGKKILVHGGGKLATRLSEKLGIKQQLIDGRRITDAETLKLVTMVYAGCINKGIVAQLQAAGCNAIGLTGADVNLIPAIKRPVKNGIDYGFVGDITEPLAAAPWQLFLNHGLAPVVAAITHDQNGQLLNTNADTLAQEIAKSLSSLYEINLIYLVEKSGVLMDAQDEQSVIPAMNFEYYQKLKAGKIIFDGMIPKLDNAFTAIKNGVRKVIIGHAKSVQNLINGRTGTSITYE